MSIITTAREELSRVMEPNTMYLIPGTTYNVVAFTEKTEMK